jgi:hypothetical protein
VIGIRNASRGDLPSAGWRRVRREKTAQHSGRDQERGAWKADSSLPFANNATGSEYGCDAREDVLRGEFDECRLITPEFPSAVAFVGVRWAERKRQPVYLNHLDHLNPEDD